MTFIVFSLDDFHTQQCNSTTRIGVRFVKARNLGRAKEFMRTYYPGAWVIVPKKVFDKGIVQAGEQGEPR